MGAVQATTSTQGEGEEVLSEIKIIEEEEESTLKDSVDELAYYCKFAVAIYGWMLHIWSHPVSGVPRLLCNFRDRNRKAALNDNFFGLHRVRR